MKKYRYDGFYGDFGYIVVHNDGTTNLEMNIPGFPIGKKTFYRKKYKTFRSAKAALTRMSDSYTLTECK